MTEGPLSQLSQSVRRFSAALERRSIAPSLWLGILGLAVLFVSLRWNNFKAPLTRDEGEYAYAAQLLRKGGMLYEQDFLQKPPMVAYTYALAGLLAPNAVWAPRVLAGIFMALAAALVGYVARREFGPGVAMTAMWLTTVMIVWPEIGEFIANTEMFMVLPMMATLAVHVRARHRHGGPMHWFSAGALATITVLYKYTVVPLMAFVFVVWTVEEWRAGKSFRNLVLRWLAAFAGAALAAAIVLGVFFVHDGGKKMWECTVTFNRYYAGTKTFGWDGLWSNVSSLLRFWWILFLLPCVLIFKRPPRTLFWAALFAITWLQTAGSYYPQYYIPIMPIWALLAAVAVRQVAKWLAAKISQKEQTLRRTIAIAVIGLVSAPDASWIIRTPDQFVGERFAIAAVWRAAPVVGARLAQIVPPDAPVYVAGSEPEVLCYAHRFSSTRYDIGYPLAIPTPLAAQFQAEAMRDLQEHPPAAIVLVRDPSTWTIQPGTLTNYFNFLAKWAQENYNAAGGYQTEEGTDKWIEPLGPGELNRCIMVLMKRK